MPNKSAEHTLPAAKTLKRAFERAVRDMYQASLTGEISKYRTPIVQRAGINASGSHVEEKRALSDAAKALAPLWKISPTSPR
jgi:hypothetical protein